MDTKNKKETKKVLRLFRLLYAVLILAGILAYYHIYRDEHIGKWVDILWKLVAFNAIASGVGLVFSFGPAFYNVVLRISTQFLKILCVIGGCLFAKKNGINILDNRMVIVLFILGLFIFMILYVSVDNLKLSLKLHARYKRAYAEYDQEIKDYSEIMEYYNLMQNYLASCEEEYGYDNGLFDKVKTFFKGKGFKEESLEIINEKQYYHVAPDCLILLFVLFTNTYNYITQEADDAWKYLNKAKEKNDIKIRQIVGKIEERDGLVEQFLRSEERISDSRINDRIRGVLEDNNREMYNAILRKYRHK